MTDLMTRTQPKLEAGIVCCGDCGSFMRVAERTIEGSTAFTWFECSRPGCPGMLLRKEPTRAPASRVAS